MRISRWRKNCGSKRVKSQSPLLSRANGYLSGSFVLKRYDFGNTHIRSLRKGELGQGRERALLQGRPLVGPGVGRCADGQEAGTVAVGEVETVCYFDRAVVPGPGWPHLDGASQAVQRSGGRRRDVCPGPGAGSLETYPVCSLAVIKTAHRYVTGSLAGEFGREFDVHERVPVGRPFDGQFGDTPLLRRAYRANPRGTAADILRLIVQRRRHKGRLGPARRTAL